MRGQILASRLLVELCGAELVPGTIDVDARLPRMEPFSLELRMDRARQLLGMEIGPALGRTYLERLGFGVEEAGETLTVAVPADRHFDMTREVDLIEEVGRVHGIDEHLPATLPSRPRRRRRPHAASSACCASPRTRSATPASTRSITWSFIAPGAAEALGGPRRARHRRPQPALGGSVGDADRADRRPARGRVLQPRPRRRPRRPVRVRPRLPARGAARAGLGARRPLRRQPPGAGAGAAPARGDRLRAARRARLAQRRRRRPSADFFAGKGLVELLCAALGAEARFDAGRAAVPAPGPRGRGRSSASAAPAGSASCTRGSRPSATCRPTVAFELDAGALIEASSRGRETYGDLTSYPGGARGPRGRRRRRRRGGLADRRRPGAPAASCSARSASSTSTRGRRSARASAASRCGSSSARPTAPSPTRRSPARAPRSSPRSPSSGASSVAEPAAARRRPRRPGARRRRLRLRRRARGPAPLAAPAPRAGRGDLAHATSAPGSTSSTRATGCRWS